MTIDLNPGSVIYSLNDLKRNTYYLYLSFLMSKMGAHNNAYFIRLLRGAHESMRAKYLNRKLPVS